MEKHFNDIEWTDEAIEFCKTFWSLEEYLNSYRKKSSSIIHTLWEDYYDEIFRPENINDFTELWKKIYELWSFKRLFKWIEISNIFIENKWKDITFKIKAKDGYSLYKIDVHKLSWWYRNARLRIEQIEKDVKIKGLSGYKFVIVKLSKGSRTQQLAFFTNGK